MTQFVPLLTRIWPYCAAALWGIAWALFLQWTTLGRFLAIRRTWITVVIGVGVDLVLVLAIIPFTWWWRVLAVIVLSSLGIIARSLINEHHEEQEALSAAKAEAQKHVHLGP